jgi:hypothetical protein
MRQKFLVSLCAVFALVFFVAHPIWAGEKIAILEGLVSDGVKVSLAGDAQLNSVRAKGYYAYLKLSPPTLNNMYKFYDSSYRFLGDMVLHKVDGVVLSGTTSGGSNVDYYYDYDTGLQLYVIDRSFGNGQVDLRMNQTIKALNWPNGPYVGPLGNFGSMGGTIWPLLPAPPRSIVLPI